MKKTKKVPKVHTLLVFVILTLVSISITSALVITNTEQKVNTFTPGNVSCKVQEDYTIKNIGNTNSYIRAEVIVNWINENGNIYAILPKYQISLGENWAQSDIDGYYYYNNEVEKEQNTTALLSDVTTNDEAAEGYTMSITSFRWE